MWGRNCHGFWALVCPCLPLPRVSCLKEVQQPLDFEPGEYRDYEEKEAVVSDSHAGEHLFIWALKQWQHLGSHQHAKALARQGRLQVNGQSVADFHRLSAGDQVTLRLDPHVLSLKHTFLRRQMVASGQSGMRLEAFCRTCFHDILTSRRSIREAIKQGSVRVNGEQVEHTRVLQEGTCVEVALPAIQALHGLCPKNCWPRIIYEDDMLAVIWKHANVKSMGGWQTAENGARLQVKPSHEADAFDERLKSIHRLDKPVAGLMLMAKTYSAHRSLMQWLKERRNISKVYRAIVFGNPLQGYQGAHGALTDQACQTWQFQVDSAVDGRAALTLGRILEELDGFHVVELSPITGRRHQLRIHMASLGCPIVGDTEYGSRSRASGILLAAVELKFLHPAKQLESRQMLEFHEEEPPHFKSWREKLSGSL